MLAFLLPPSLEMPILIARIADLFVVQPQQALLKMHHFGFALTHSHPLMRFFYPVIPLILAPSLWLYFAPASYINCFVLAILGSAAMLDYNNHLYFSREYK